jgi:hypothetical protein
MVNTAITSTAVAGMPTAQVGVASGISSASRQVGLALGVSITGSVLNSGLHGPGRAGFVGASHAGWGLLAGCGYLVLLLGLVTTSRPALRTAAHRPGLAGQAPQAAGPPSRRRLQHQAGGS